MHTKDEWNRTVIAIVRLVSRQNGPKQALGEHKSSKSDSEYCPRSPKWGGESTTPTDGLDVEAVASDRGCLLTMG